MFTRLTEDIWVDLSRVQGVEFIDVDRSAKPKKGKKAEKSMIIVPEHIKRVPKCRLHMAESAGGIIEFELPDGMSDLDVMAMLDPRASW